MNEFLVDILDEDKVSDIYSLLQKCLDLCIRFHKEVFKVGAHCTSFGDSVAGPDLVSPKIYRSFAKPYQYMLAEELKKDGIMTVCYICGCTNVILDDMAETGFAGYEIDYKTNIIIAKGVLKGKAVMFGNIDPSGVICMGSVEDIRAATHDLINVYKKDS